MLESTTQCGSEDLSHDVPYPVLFNNFQRYANKCQLTAISVGYRLAPKNVYPAAAQDCVDAAKCLDHGIME